MRNTTQKIAMLLVMATTVMAMNGQIKISGTVVDEQQFPVGEILLQHRLDGLLQKALGVEHGCDDGNRGRW